MADHQADYLAECLAKGICPTCQKPLVERHGSGRFADGVFCSLGCEAKWRGPEIARRHREKNKEGHKTKNG